MKIVVAGLGPTGVSVVRELMRQGVPPKNVLMLDASLELLNSKPLTRKSGRRESIYEAVLRERDNRGLGKIGQSLTHQENRFKTPSSVWGVSCFPPLDWDIGTDRFSKNEVANAYRRVSEEMKIQAEESSDLHFQISGEEIGKLKRKLLSYEIALVKEFSHSRLAIRTMSTEADHGCTLTGNCFVNCPNSAPWNPAGAIKNLINEFPGIQYRCTPIVEINIADRSIETFDSVVEYDKLYLGVGATETHRLLQKNFTNKIKFDSTPVAILPLYFKKRQNINDYYKSFLFTDLIVPQVSNNTLKSLTQIYLPTKEITARAISRLPRLFHRVLASSMEKQLSPFFQRIGIAMIFLQATDIENQKLNSSELKAARKELKNVLKKASIKIIRGKRELLLQGSSYHHGSIRFSDEHRKGIESRLFATLVNNQIYVTDTSSLPHIPPGPHTSISACLAKLIVEKSLK